MRHIDWSRFDAVLMRSTWDYHTRYAEFIAWLERLQALRVPTINSTALLRWNSDKRYLLQLPAFDVDIVPTQITPGSELIRALDHVHGREVIVKPTVSASAWCTVRGLVGSAELAGAVANLPVNLDYLVQPFVAEVALEGEWSLLFFDGAYSHAVLKRPAQGDYRVQREFGGTTESISPDDATIAAAERAVRAVESLGYERTAYARIDGVRSGGRFLIMEVEMIEPFLFLSRASMAPQRFAEAILAALTRVRVNAAPSTSPGSAAGRPGCTP